MATKISHGLQPSNSTNTHFRRWLKFIIDAMIAGGWVQTADTGQINPATVLAPGGVNTAMGYAIFRMDDALATDSPVYVRLDFGSSGAAAAPGLWISIGSGSDGAGTITPSWLLSSTASAPLLAPVSNTTTNSSSESFGSVDTNRCQFAMFFSYGSRSFQIMWSIERTKDASGSDTDEGVMFLYGADSLAKSRILYAAPILQPALETEPSFVLTQQSLSALSEEVGMSPVYVFAGLVQQPGTGFLIARSGDWTPAARVRVQIYGEFVTYQRLLDSVRVGSADALATVFIRFD